MFDEFNRHIGTENSTLIVCGSEHIEGLTNLFGAAGPDVTNEDVTKARLVRSNYWGMFQWLRNTSCMAACSRSIAAMFFRVSDELARLVH